MIKMREAFENLSADELRQLMDAPAWMALMAAYSTDGRLTDSERDGAIRLAHVRSFTAPKSIRSLYIKISKDFPQRLLKLNSRLPEKKQDKLTYIRAQVKSSHKLLTKLDSDVAETLEENLNSFYKHVFNSDKGFFHYFALPVFSNRLEKHVSGYRKPQRV